MHTQFNNNEELGYFPFEYFVDFLRFLRRNEDTIEIITYNDLSWADDYNYVNNYPVESENWKNQFNSGGRDKNKIYLLIQHDVDKHPERTMAALREEERFGIPSNVMIFNRRISRTRLQDTGEIQYTDYSLDEEYLRHLQDNAGFVIGYHSNALEQGLFNREKAKKIFENDVSALRNQFNISFFSPHGGARGPEGFSNSGLEVPESLKKSVRWVHNKHTVRFDGQYSDGGFNMPEKYSSNRDLRDFVRKWTRGRRYRILIHPQYYHTPFSPSKRMVGTPWYDDLLNAYATGNGSSVWSEISLPESNLASVSRHYSNIVSSFKKLIRKYCGR